MKKMLLVFTGLLLLAGSITSAQGILDPADTLVPYNPAAPPAQPQFGKVGKWVRTEMPDIVRFNTSSYKAYIYKSLPFRLKFPKTYQHKVADGKKYPIFIFWHGRGEAGTIYNNEYQLMHGGEVWRNNVDNGSFDGFLLYPQNQTGGWSVNDYTRVRELLDILVDSIKVDKNRIIVNGLSAGGSAAWDFMLNNPAYVAASLPISAAGIGLTGVANNYKFTPVWLFQGELDNAPTKYTSDQVVNAARNVGANIRYTVYPQQGHGVWYMAWGEPGFLPFINQANRLTPWPLFGRSEFCPGDPINITIGITRGFEAYEWRKDGQLIAGATTNELNVTSLGTYSVRARQGGVWTEWSPTPLVIRIKPPTQTPPITIAGLRSDVLPAPDGSTSVPLRLPDNYVNYEWKAANGTQVLGTDSVFVAPGPGEYVARVTEQYGCSSNYSVPYKVIPASGAHAPDAVSGLTVQTVSKTQLRLDWTDKPNPAYNETLFEVYRGLQPGGPYTLIAKVPANVVTYTDEGLAPNTAYYYIVRPVNSNGAAPVSQEARGSTDADLTPPSAPENLKLDYSTRNSLAVSWSAATDEVGVTGYEVYVNDVKTFTLDATQLSAKINALQPLQVYRVTVKAKDGAGNVSAPSSQLNAATLKSGLNYKYYQGSWNTLPDFNALTPVKTGISPTVDITPRLQDDNFGFLWEGYLNIPVAGTYTFETNSDDGSRFYFNTAYSAGATPLVDNDGLHGTTSKSATITLQPGVYPIAVTFFEKTGGEVMQLRWKCAELGITSLTPVAAQYFQEAFTMPGTAPAMPSALGALPEGYNKVNVSWKDNSSNETGFEVLRAAAKAGPFQAVGTVKANTTAFTDQGLEANTRYYYKVRAIGQYGGSDFSTGISYGAIWPFNNSGEDVSYNSNTATLSNAGYSATGKEGTHSLSLNGTNGYAAIGGSGSGFLHDTFTARTVGLWIKPSLLDNNNRIIFDIGGSDNGLALRAGNGKLEAAAASSGISYKVSANFSSTGWTHVAVVFDNGALRLYINGTQAAAGNAMFSNIRATSNNSRIGGNNGSNAFGSNGSMYAGNIDYFVIINNALPAADVAKLAGNTYPAATALTGMLPEAPAAPTALAATALSASAIRLNWTDNATTETKYEVYRSISNNSDFRLLVKLDSIAGTGNASFTDTALFGNERYYYKIRATGPGGSSAYSGEATALTLNSKPVLQSIDNKYMRYGTSLQIPLDAKDADGDALGFSFLNLPGFVTHRQEGDNSYLEATPAIAQQGVYSNITVIAADNSGAADTVRFTLTVNDNYNPVINSIPAVNATEMAPVQVTARMDTTNNSGKTFTWEGVNLPSFVTVTSNDTTAAININPLLSDAGTYTVTLKVTDSKGGTATQSFTVNVADKDPVDKVYIRFKKNLTAPAPWNNISGFNTYNLLNSRGEATGIDLLVQGTWYETGPEGPTTYPNNTGVFPDVVLKEYYIFGSYPRQFTGAEEVDMKFTGLATNRRYTFKIHAGSRYAQQADNGSTTFTIGSESRTLAVQNNTANTVTIADVLPDSTGSIILHLSKPEGVKVGFFNGAEITSTLFDGTAPRAPQQLKAVLQADNSVQLNWANTADNERQYEVYRSLDSLDNYSLLATLPAKSNAYNDATANGLKKYFYKVRAVNYEGASPYSNIAVISLPNKLPVIEPIADVRLRAGSSATVSVRAKDDPADVVTLQAIGLPSFASLQDNGNGEGQISISAAEDRTGAFNVTLVATDNLGGVSRRSFTIHVMDKNITRTYIRFGETGTPPAPWNNVAGYMNAGTKLTNALDETGAATGVNLALQEGWYGGSASKGVNATENQGVYPDMVIRGHIYEKNATAHIVRLSGLNNSKTYNFVFFNSSDFGADGTTRFTINGQYVQLNAAYNTSKTVQLNGIKPVNGVVDITVNKESASYYAYLSALVLEAYDDTVSVIAPAGLRATVKSSGKIALQWADRAYDESGYEVWRSASEESGYAMVATLAANTTAYTDSSLAENTAYYYKVRAVTGSRVSGFSNTANGVTYAISLYVNINEAQAAGTPWNNTSARPMTGTLIADLKDDKGNSTGISLEMPQAFDFTYVKGVNTGNNSGIFPDKVMMENYQMFPGMKATMKFTGLNISLAYDISFFLSANEYVEYTSKFTVNGTRVTYLNGAQNRSGLATLYNIRPNQDGEIVFVTELAYANTLLGMLGAVVLQGHTVPEPAPDNSAQRINNNRVMTAQQATAVKAPAPEPKAGGANNITGVNVYPNPFVEMLNADIDLAKATDVLVIDVFDLGGRNVHREVRKNVPAGRSTIRMVVSSRQTARGIYLIRFTTQDGDNKVIKLVRQ